MQTKASVESKRAVHLSRLGDRDRRAEAVIVGLVVGHDETEAVDGSPHEHHD
jgi:hypothetical protein